MKLRTLYEPYPQDIQDQLDALHVDHATSVVVDDHEMVVGYIMCHRAGPKDARLHCECAR